MNTVLYAISFKTHQWNICGDLKVIAMLMGMYGGFTKYCCFLCLWDSQSTAEHYVKRNWQPSHAYTPGTSSVKFLPLVDPNKIYLPPLHIKSGLMKNLVEAMGKANSGGFQYLVKKFPSISARKLKEGIFIGPQIKSVLHDEEFKQSLSAEELEALEAFVWLVENFLDFPPENLGMVNDEQGEQFYKDIQLMEHRYQGFWNESRMADYCRILYHDYLDVAYTRKSYSKCF